jgi:hypothetical protein
VPNVTTCAIFAARRRARRRGRRAADRATLSIDDRQHESAGRLAVDNSSSRPCSVPGAEADALANMTFAGSPLRVYLAFVPLADGGGDALVLIALFDDERVEVRMLRSGSSPLYAIFALKSG